MLSRQEEWLIFLSSFPNWKNIVKLELIKKRICWMMKACLSCCNRCIIILICGLITLMKIERIRLQILIELLNQYKFYIMRFRMQGLISSKKVNNFELKIMKPLWRNSRACSPVFTITIFSPYTKLLLLNNWFKWLSISAESIFKSQDSNWISNKSKKVSSWQKCLWSVNINSHRLPIVVSFNLFLKGLFRLSILSLTTSCERPKSSNLICSPAEIFSS